MHSYPYVNFSIFIHLNRKYIYTSLWPPMMFLFSAFLDARWPSSVLSWPWAVPRRWAKGAVDEWRQMKKDDQINQDHVMSGDFMWFHVIYFGDTELSIIIRSVMTIATRLVCWQHSVHYLNPGHCGPVISHIFGLTKPGFFSSIPTCLAKSRARGQPPFHLAIDKTCFLRVYRLYRELYYPVLWGLS